MSDVKHTQGRSRFPQGERIGGPPVTSEADHFYVCEACKQAVDMRDLGQVLHHEEAGHAPIPADDAALDSWHAQPHPCSQGACALVLRGCARCVGWCAIAKESDHG